MRRVVLVRHGETPWNVERRLQGWAPVGLSRRGHEQAAALGDALADGHDVDRIVSSDLVRTRQTARHLAAATGAPLRLDRGWRERGFGAYEGLDYDKVAARHPDLDLETTSIVGLSTTPDGGERLAEVVARVAAAWERLVSDWADAGRGGAADRSPRTSERARDADETVVVVTHGGPLRLLLGRLSGRSTAACLRTPHPINCATNKVRVTGDGAFEVVRENDDGHLP